MKVEHKHWQCYRSISNAKDTCSSSRIGSPTLSGSISTPLGRTRNCLWQLLVETLLVYEDYLNLHLQYEFSTSRASPGAFITYVDIEDANISTY
jgi:hypothetical protein